MTEVEQLLAQLDGYTWHGHCHAMCLLRDETRAVLEAAAFVNSIDPFLSLSLALDAWCAKARKVLG